MRGVVVSIVFLSGIAPVAAQSASVSLSALTPLAITVQDGAASVQSTRPAGPLGSVGNLQAFLPSAAGAGGELYWDVLPGRAARVLCSLQGVTSTSQVRSGPQEFLVQFTASAVVPASIRIFRQSEVTAGVAWPVVRLDYDNDGTIDVQDVTQGFSFHPAPASFGAQPAFVRVVLDAAVAGIGSASASLEVEIVAQNDLQLSRVALACAPSAFEVYPVFLDRGLRADLFAPLVPVVHVVGLQAQPLLLPSVASVPCLLVPVPDILLFDAGGRLHIPLPPALRPNTFWLQGVMVLGPELATTDAYRVDVQ